MEAWQWCVFVFGISVMLTGLYGLFTAGLQARALQEKAAEEEANAKAEKKAISMGAIAEESAPAADDDQVPALSPRAHRPSLGGIATRKMSMDGNQSYTPNYGGSADSVGSSASASSLGSEASTRSAASPGGGRVSFASPSARATPSPSGARHPAALAAGRERASSRSRLQFLEAANTKGESRAGVE